MLSSEYRFCTLQKHSEVMGLCNFPFEIQNYETSKEVDQQPEGQFLHVRRYKFNLFEKLEILDIPNACVVQFQRRFRSKDISAHLNELAVSCDLEGVLLSLAIGYTTFRLIPVTFYPIQVPSSEFYFHTAFCKCTERFQTSERDVVSFAETVELPHYL